MHKIKRSFKGVAVESKRVRWPHKKELWSAVGIVCSVTITTALVLLVSDLLAANLIKGFEEAFPKPSSSPETSGELDNIMFLLGGLFR